MVKVKRVEYTRGGSGKRTYVIEADMHGAATIWLDGKVVKHLTVGIAQGRGSLREQDEGIAYAQAVIERLLTDEG